MTALVLLAAAVGVVLVSRASWLAVLGLVVTLGMAVLVPAQPFDRAAYAAAMNDHYDALDRALVAKGFPATSPWMREQVRRYFEHGGRQVVWRIGRRGGKSTTICRVGVVEALYGAHAVPPGDLGVVAVISVSRDEASQRLRTIKAILDALGVSWRPIDGGIELVNRPIAFKVYTASVAGVSGFTCICALCDEVAKWKDIELGVNPAREVLSSVRPCLATMPRAKVVLSSSPLGTQDAHAAAFDAGESDFQTVSFAPTWVANPTISEADTFALEPHEPTRLREYGALAQASAVGALDPALNRAMVRPLGPGAEIVGQAVAVFDLSSGGGDAAVMMLVRAVQEYGSELPYLPETNPEKVERARALGVTSLPAYDSDGRMVQNPAWNPAPRTVFHVFSIDALEGEFRQRVSYDRMVSGFCEIARWGGARRAVGDEHLAFANAAEFKRHGVTFEGLKTTPDALAESAGMLRLLQRDSRIAIAPGIEAEKTVTELNGLQEVILPSGRISLRSRRTASGHGDRASCVLLIARLIAGADGMMPGAPSYLGGRVSEWDPYRPNAD